MADNRTVFQMLGGIFTNKGVDLSSIQNKQPQQPTVTSYKIDNNELFKTKNKDEYEKTLLQKRQQEFLNSLWNKVDGELFQKYLHNENTRIASYVDFEAMEYFPEISTALDIIAEEATVLNQKGQMLSVYSDSERVKKALEDLFYNRLSIHTNLPMWVRHVAKYGDNFVFLKVEEKKGIIACRQLPVFEIERNEGDIRNYIQGNSADKLKFIWKGKNLEFNPFQILHFRLLMDDKKLPYGMSILEKARRIWKMLLLSEDAMLVYRVLRAPERRIFKVFVGNIDDQDIPAYIEEIANRFKRKEVVDPRTGQVNLSYNVMSNDQDIIIPIRSSDDPSSIETLPGLTGANEIGDIEHFQNKLFAAIRVPKPFINFTQDTGNGKNLALMDVRFARMVNRVQQAVLLELNKAAIIHLITLGLDDELNNFKLTLNNPSTQAEMLWTEHLQAKINVYKSAVENAGNGFGAMSMLEAQKTILGKTDSEVREMLLQQRMEKAASVELENTPNVIKHTKVFDKVDKLYGDYEMAKKGGIPDEGEPVKAPESSGGGGGGFGGDFSTDDFSGDVGSEDLEGFGEDGDVDASDLEGLADEGGEPEITPEEPPIESLSYKGKNIITEETKNKIKKYNTIYLNKLVKNMFNEETPKSTQLYEETFKINEEINSIVEDIDKFLNS